ncbi:MAG TPA: hypothetical protein VEQ59_20280 [Polyangiaceae bacterium]|nr:hypothetical protein [Polyangiaceae bacterium]
MNPRTVRRAAAAALLTAISCNVYDPSLLVGGGGGAGNGGTPNGGSGGGTAGTENGDDAGAGNVGVAGTQPGGGSSSGGSESMGGEPAQLGGQGGAEVGEGGAGASTAGSGGSTAGTTTGGVGGVGGSGGSGTAGKGGTAGTGGNAGSGGSGGSGGTGGTSATGCAKISVPVDATSDRAHVLVSLTNPADLSAATITIRLYVQAGKAGTLFPYVQDGSYAFLGAGVRPALSSFSGWSTLTWNVGDEPLGSSGISKNSIKRIGLEINGVGSSSGWSNPTILYIDSISVNTATPISITLDTTATVTPNGTSSDVANQSMWWNNNNGDTNTGNVTLSWQATCP